MVIPDKTIFIQAVNFLVTIFVLNVLLIKPIREIIKKRKGLMADQLETIEGFNSEAEAKMADYEAQLAEARKEANDIRNSMKDEGAAKELALMTAAGEEASSAIQSARAQIKTEMQGAMDQLTKEVDTFAKAATGKLLG